MKLFLNADSHGEKITGLRDNEDLVLIAGDFSDGSKLRDAVFGKGSIEDAKLEIVKSAKSFLEDLPKKSIIVPGNVEKLCLDQVSKMAKDLGHSFLENEVIEVNGLKIAGLKFFMEEWWAKINYPEDQDKIARAKKEEKETKDFLDANPNTDIVLTHLPPFEILDKDPNPPKNLPKNYTKNCGSKVLLDYIKKNKPKLVVCGHIHFPGEILVGETRIINPGNGKLVSILED